MGSSEEKMGAFGKKSELREETVRIVVSLLGGSGATRGGKMFLFLKKNCKRRSNLGTSS